MPQSDMNHRWLPSLGLVVALHAAVWWGAAHFGHGATRPVPLPVMHADLLPPPPPPKVEPVRPPPTPKPEPEPPKPRMQKPLEPPPPLPVLSSQAADAPVMPAPPVEEIKPVQAPPQPVAPPPVAAPRPAPVLEPPRFQAAYLSNPPPLYPLAARRRGIEGTVLVHAEVSAEGACLRAELKKSSGAEMLDQAALEAVRKWRFVPAKRGAVAVVAWVEVPLTFKLEN